jgi:hypothetical protein
MADGISVPSTIAKQLRPNALTPLETALEQLSKWTSNLPPRSKFYSNQRITVHDGPALRRSRAKVESVVTADVLFDIHSLFAAQCLLKSWRSAQLADGLAVALGSWNLTVAAAMVRSLVETASAWTIESRDVAAVWRKLKATSVRSVEDAMRVRGELYQATTQMAWGTRLSRTTRASGFKRTNILTLIQKAEKQCPRPKLVEDYEILCDAVHPSWGAGECFWSQYSLAADIQQARVLIGTDAVGWLGVTDQAIKVGSALSETIVACGAWAMQALAADLPSFNQVCRDLCLTARVYLLSNLDYWGIVQPTSTYAECACGSGRKTRFCSHEFGREEAS